MAFNGRFVNNVIDFASQRGADAAQLYEMVGADAGQLQQEGFQISNESFDPTMLAAIEMTGDEDLGLHAGEYLNLSAAGIMLQIMQACSQIEEALQFVCSYANLGCSSLPMQMAVEGDELVLTVHPERLWWERSPKVVEQMIDGLFAFTLREIQTLIFQRYPPIRVEYSFVEGRERSERSRVLGAPIVFAASRNALILPVVVLEQPILSRDFELLALLVSHAEKKLQRLAGQYSFSSLVRRTILNLVKPQFPTAEEVAANLNQSVRTLQRKLKEEQTSFKEVLESIKYELAKVYLQRPQLSVADISDLLQYAEPSGFIRSFKRWTGQTPRQFREG